MRLGLAAGLGLAVQPLVYLWASLLGLRLGPAFWWLVLGASAVVVAVGAFAPAGGIVAVTDRGPPQWALLGILRCAAGGALVGGPRSHGAAVGR